MKPILSAANYPKFLVVNKEPTTQGFNKHLLKPWEEGELVKVAPFDEQKRNDKYDDMFKYSKPDNNVWNFRKRYVKVIRKDEEGKWTLVYTASWSYFNQLTKNKKK